MKNFTASIRLISFCCLLLLSSTRTIAQEYKPLRFLLTGAFEFGGDAIATVAFTNGDEQKVNAGQGVSVGAGVEFTAPKIEQLRLRATVGIKYVTTAADNAHIRLTRIPLIVSANYVIQEKWRIGMGLAMHSNIKFNADGLGDNFTLKNSSGPVFEVAYKWIGISYTSMKYKDQFGESYNANAFGVTLSGVIPGRK